MAGDPQFHAILQEMGEVHERKSSDYGSGKDPLANLRASAEFGVEPWRATLVRFNDKVQRLKSFCENGRLACEGVEDAMLDAANYAVLALVLYREAQAKAKAP
jgi:hypothetical protein